MSKTFYKRLCIIFIALCITIGTLGCADIKNKITSLVSTTETKKDTNEPTAHKIGDTVELKDFKITINGVRKITADKNNIVKPKNGNEFILIDCTIENISSETKDVSAINIFKVVDKDGASYDKTLFTDTNGNLEGKIEPTKIIKGEYWVEVPTGKDVAELEFDQSLTNNIRQTVVLDGSTNQSKGIILNKPYNVETGNGTYSLTIEGARLSNKRNDGLRIKVDKVVYLDYSYENKSYGEKIGRDLYIDSNSFKVTDDEGKVLETYPVDDDNRIIKKVPIGGKCNGSIAYAINGNSKNINVTFIGDSKKVGPIKVPIKQ